MKTLIKICFLVCFVLSILSFVYAQNSGEDYFKKGLEYQNKGMNEQAISEYKKAISLNSAHSDALFNISQLYFKTNRFQEAAEGFKKVVDLNPYDGGACFALAVSYAHLGRYAEALKYNDKAQELHYPEAEEFGKQLERWRVKEINFEYTPIRTPQKLAIKIKGPTVGDSILINDIIKNIDMIYPYSQATFKNIDVEFISAKDDKSEWKWIVKWSNETETPFSVELITSPQGGTDILVHEIKPGANSSQKIIIDTR